MKKWNFYKNLSKRDFEKLKLKEYFSDYGIWEDKISRDLYFLGIKKGKLSKSQEIEKFSDYIIYQNSLVIKRDERLQKKILKIFKYICQNYLSKLIPDKYFRNLWIFIKKLVP
jgi:hypothetical protein